MSQMPVLERPVSPDRNDWIELDSLVESTSDVLSVHLRGHGKDHHGVIGQVVAAGPDPTPVPSLDGWDF